MIKVDGRLKKMVALIHHETVYLSENRRGDTASTFNSLLALYTKLLAGKCLIHIGREVTLCISIVALTHISTNDSKVSYHPSDPWNTFD
jgi:hypothetical protein